MHREDMTNGPHEGEWIYVSAPFSHLNGTARALFDQVKHVICERGWTVLAADDPGRGPSRRIAALRSADACLFDISCESATIGAEIATALCTGRPVIALEHEDSPASELITALVTHGEATRIIRYGQVDDCVAALGETLADPIWLEAVGRGTVQHGGRRVCLHAAPARDRCGRRRAFLAALEARSLV
jgi:hypothetical protein